MLLSLPATNIGSIPPSSSGKATSGNGNSSSVAAVWQTDYRQIDRQAGKQAGRAESAAAGQIAQLHAQR